MRFTRLLQMPRVPSSYIDYARHMPKAYVERVKRTVPKKVFTDRFGAPDVIRWNLHPDDYKPSLDRPWEDEQLKKSLERSNKYTQAKLSKKFFPIRREASRWLAHEEWTVLCGDRVQVMVGKDAGKQATVIRVSRETSEVLVDGCHTKLMSEMDEGAERFGIDRQMRWKEQPLSVSEGQVMLVDPNDEQPCEAVSVYDLIQEETLEQGWKLNAAGDEYIRVSSRSGFEIPIPNQALVTYEYLQPEKYIDVEEKDTPPELVLQRTYIPKLTTFQDDIMQEMNIKEDRQRKPTYWY